MFCNVVLYNHFLALLSQENVRLKTDVLQNLFFLLLSGKKLHPEQWERLLPVLVWNASNNTSDDLRRWAYQVGIFSRIKNGLLVNFCKNNLEKDKNKLNRTWIIAILANNLSNNEFYEIIGKSNHGLSEENIDVAKYLFFEQARLNYTDVLKRSDPLSLMWLASIGAYKNIATINQKESIISSLELSQLTDSTDNDEALKHAMYAFYLQDTFNIDELPFSPYAYNKMGEQQKKWFFTLIWKDTNFIARNIDFVKEILGKKHLSSLCGDAGEEVRIGIARGLAHSEYVKEISDEVIDWYSHCDTQSALYHLLKYININRNHNVVFDEIINYQESCVANNMQLIFPSETIISKSSPYIQLQIIENGGFMAKNLQKAINNVGLVATEPHPQIMQTTEKGINIGVAHNPKIEIHVHEKETVHKEPQSEKYRFVFTINLEGKAEPFTDETKNAIQEWFDEKASDVISEMRDENLRDTFMVEIEDERITNQQEIDATIRDKLANNEELSIQEEYLKWGIKRVLKRDNTFTKSALEMFLSNRVVRGSLGITHPIQYESMIKRLIEFRYGDFTYELPNNRELISLDVYLNSNRRNAKHEEFITYVKRADVEKLFGGTGVYDLWGRSVLELNNCLEDVIIHYAFFLAELDLSDYDFSKDDRMLNLTNFWIGLH